MFKKIKTSIGRVYYFYKYLSLFTPFLKSTISFASKLEENNIQRKKIALIIHPWDFSPMPFYTLTVGFFLKKRGHDIIFVVDDFNFGQEKKLLFKLKFIGIKLLLRLVDPKLITDFKSQRPVTSGNLSKEVIADMAQRNAVHYLKGELKQEGRAEYEKLVYSQLLEFEPYIHSFFVDSNYDCIYFPGGVYGTSSLYNELCKKYNVRGYTFDCDYGVMVTSTPGIATHFTDIPIAYKLIKSQLNNHLFEQICRIVDEQIREKTVGKDRLNSQIVEEGSGMKIENVGCLIVLNISWDSSALGINSIFSSYYQWLLHTVEQVLNNTDSVVTIRQHPRERLPGSKSNDDFETLLTNRFGNTKRMNFIRSEDNVNTYELVNKAELVVVYSSTVGVEAVIAGKPVIVASNCYYTDMGFVNRASTIEEYNTLLVTGCNNQLIATDTQKSDAIICYYLGISCNLVFTEFTPVYTDYEKWVVYSPEKLYLKEEVQDYLTSIQEGIPLCYLVYKKQITIENNEYKLVNNV